MTANNGVKRCPTCSRIIRPGSRSCTGCGRALVGTVHIEFALSPEKIARLVPRLEAVGVARAATQRALSVGGNLVSGVSFEKLEQIEPILQSEAVGYTIVKSDNRKAYRILAACAAIVIVFYGVRWGLATEDNAAATTPLPLDVSASRSIVRVIANDVILSGFVIGRDRVVTVLDPIKGAKYIRLTFADGQSFGAKIKEEIATIGVVELAVATGSTPDAPWGDAMALRQGDTIGMSPRSPNTTASIVSGIVGHTTRPSFGLAYLQVDGPLEATGIGGPVFDTEGRVVGMVTGQVAGESGVSLALPINYMYGLDPSRRPPDVDRERWQARIRAAKAGETADVEAIAETEGTSLILDAAVVDGAPGMVSAILARRSKYKPSSGPVELTAEWSTVAQCTIKGRPRGWFYVDASKSNELPAQVGMWLKRNRVRLDFWVAEVVLDGRGCMPRRPFEGVKVVMPGAKDGPYASAIVGRRPAGP